MLKHTVNVPGNMIQLRWLKIWRFILILGIIIIDSTLIWICGVKGDDDLRYAEIEIESGRVRGKLNATLFDEKPFYSFRGIPYAEKPINDLRFKVKDSIHSCQFKLITVFVFL